MALLLRIVDAKGAARLVEVQPGAALAIQPGDTVTLADPAQAAGIQFARSGNNLVIVYAEGQVSLTGFYALITASSLATISAGSPAPEFDLSLPDRPVIRITRDADLTQINLDAAGPSSALYDPKLSGLNLHDSSPLPEDRSGPTGGNVSAFFAGSPLILSNNTPPPTPPERHQPVPSLPRACARRIRGPSAP